MSIDELTLLFCQIDDLCQSLVTFNNQPLLNTHQKTKKRNRKIRMSPSEMITIVVHFHLSGARTFKGYYKSLQQYHSNEFPTLLSYNRFVEHMPRILTGLCSVLDQVKAEPTGIAFIDSTAIVVCKNKRISSNRVFKGVAARGKTTMGYFFGFKLHLVINELGGLVEFRFTPGNVHDIKPVKALTKNLKGKLIGDKAYISKPIFAELKQRGLQLITPIRRNMANKLMPMEDKILLRKRSIIETVNGQLKFVCQLEHSRHRSVWNFMVHAAAAIAAYIFKPNKPSINLTTLDQQLILGAI